MNGLTLEQCKKLKEWGLTQDNSVHAFRKNGALFLRTEVENFDNFIACPDLEQLLELAADFLDEVRFRCHRPYEWNAAGCTTSDNTEYSTSDFDPKQAIYKLLEQVLFPAGTPAQQKDI